jgi:hypothetical protein
MTFSYALQQFLFTVILPFVVSGVAYFILRAIAPKTSIAGAVVAGYLAGHIALQGLPPLPPTTIFHYLPFLAIISLAVPALETFWSKYLYIKWAVRLVILLGLLLYILRKVMQNKWQVWESVIWLAGLSVVLLLVWWVLGRLSQTPVNLPASMFFIALVILVAGSSITALATGSVKLGQLGGTLAASLGMMMLLSWFMKMDVTPYLASVFIFLQGGLWLGAIVFSKTPVISGIILAFSPLLLLIRPLPNTLQNHVIRLVLFGLPVVVVAGLALWKFMSGEPAF